MKNKTAAIVTVFNAPDMSRSGRNRVAKWLEDQARTIRQNSKALAGRFTARYIYALAIACAVIATPVSAQQGTDAPADTTLGAIGGVIGDFFKNNPTEKWDVSAYGLNNTRKSIGDINGWGGGTRLSYWLNPTVGASLDLSYCDSSWTFASIGLGARGTIKLGTFGTVSPYITAGPGVNIKPANADVSPTIVVVAGGGASIHIEKIPWFDLFAEYRHVTTSEPQDLIIFGLTKRF